MHRVQFPEDFEFFCLQVFGCFWKVGPCQSWSFEFQTGFKVVSNCVQNEVLMEV